MLIGTYYAAHFVCNNIRSIYQYSVIHIYVLKSPFKKINPLLRVYIMHIIYIIYYITIQFLRRI